MLDGTAATSTGNTEAPKRPWSKIQELVCENAIKNGEGFGQEESGMDRAQSYAKITTDEIQEREMLKLRNRNKHQPISKLAMNSEKNTAVAVTDKDLADDDICVAKSNSKPGLLKMTLMPM